MFHTAPLHPKCHGQTDLSLMGCSRHFIPLHKSISYLHTTGFSDSLSLDPLPWVTPWFCLAPGAIPCQFCLVCFDLIPQAFLCLLLLKICLPAISSWSSLLLHFPLARPLCSMTKTVISSTHKTRKPFNSWRRGKIFYLNTIKHPFPSQCFSF